MKRFLTLAISFLIISAGCFAQEKAAPQKHHNGERARAEKIGYLTQRLNLTPEEAQVFWPVYNQYEAAAKEAAKAVKDARKALRQKKDEPAISEKDMKARIDAYLAACEAESKVLPGFNKKFLQVLPAEKVGKLYIAEAQFSNMMLNQLAKRGHKGAKNPQAMKKGQHPGNCAKQGDCKMEE